MHLTKFCTVITFCFTTCYVDFIDMKVTQYMTATPPWYKADDACKDTNYRVSLVSYWSTHTFNTANKKGFYYFADPVGCNTSNHVTVRHAIQHKLTHNSYFLIATFINSSWMPLNMPFLASTLLMYYIHSIVWVVHWQILPNGDRCHII